VTAKGKITAARLQRGDRILVRWYGPRLEASHTKRQGAFPVTVERVEEAINGRRIGRQITARTDAPSTVHYLTVSASQTFWLALER
jgi:hypothetical protein